MSTIETAGALRPGTTDTPLDQRSRISTLDDMAALPLPYVGQIVYCLDTGRYYKIQALKSKLIGALTVPDAEVDSYIELPVTPDELEPMIIKTAEKLDLKGEKGDPGVLENMRFEITSVTDNVIILEDSNAFPVAVHTYYGNCYPVEKESIFKSGNKWAISIDKYLAYDDIDSFIAPWYVYCAGGIKGDPGWNFDPDARGLISERAAYDEEQKGFAFLAIDEGNMYFKLSGDPGDWSSAVLFRGEKGEKGDPGNPGGKGEKGDKGEPGGKGDTGSLTVEVSATVPLSPVEGMVWIYEA